MFFMEKTGLFSVLKSNLKTDL